MIVLSPETEAECAEIVAGAAARGERLAITGGNTRSGLGRPVEADAMLTTTAMSGITLYEPSELVIGARAGTPLAEIEAVLAEKGQMLPFEPMDHRQLYGTNGEPMVGALAAANISGPRRISVGAARDHLIGVRLVNGRGEIVKSGGRVMKNVTGLDLVKLSAGAYGTLGILTEIVFKLLPRPAVQRTLVWRGLDDRAAIAAMAAALGSPFEIAAAAHLPAEGDFSGRTLIRLEGFAPSLTYRGERLMVLLAEHGEAEILEGEDQAGLWRGVRDCAMLAGPEDSEIWRVSVAPSKGADLVARLSGLAGLRHYYDWGGGLVWISLPGTSPLDTTLFSVAAEFGGHATLVRASAERRAAGPVFQPPAPAVMALTRGVKHSLDPKGVLNFGRMYEGL